MSEPSIELPMLDGPAWAKARDAVHAYARVIGKIRGAVAYRQKHWWHLPLRTFARGLTTGTVHVPWGGLEIRLDLLDGHATMMSSDGRAKRLLLTNLSARALATHFVARLAGWGVIVDVDPDEFDDTTLPADCIEQMRALWRATLWVDTVLNRLRAEQRNETSPVYLWPHHFDLSMLWFSGRKVPGTDPFNEEQADEQMNFGFAFGDTSHPDPYFYITAYPLPDGLSEIELPDFASWRQDDWTGIFAAYDDIRTLNRPSLSVIDLMRSALATGESLME